MSNANYSVHASKRLQQRGIPQEVTDLILKYGSSRRRPGGAVEYYFKRSDKAEVITQLKRLIKKIDALDGKGVLVDEGNHAQVISVYHLYK